MNQLQPNGFRLPTMFPGMIGVAILLLTIARPSSAWDANMPVTTAVTKAVAASASRADAPTCGSAIRAAERESFALERRFVSSRCLDASAERQEKETPQEKKQPPAEEKPKTEPASSSEQQADDQQTQQPDKPDDQKPMTERERMIAEANRRRLEEKEVRPNKPEIRRVVKDHGPLELTFDDIKFDMGKNEPFQRSMLTDQIKSYHGRIVRLRGFIRPGAKQENLSRFVFVRDDKECCFGPGAAIYDCVLVQMHRDHLTDFTVRPITLEGQFYLKEYKGPDGRVWAIYRLKNAKRL